MSVIVPQNLPCQRETPGDNSIKAVVVMSSIARFAGLVPPKNYYVLMPMLIGPLKVMIPSMFGVNPPTV